MKRPNLRSVGGRGEALENQVDLDCSSLSELEEAPVVGLKPVVELSSSDVLDEASSEKNLRRHFRYRYGGRVVIYDDQLSGMFKGNAVDLNAKGVGVITRSKDIRKSQTLVIEFLGCGHLPPFRAICEVMYVEDKTGSKTQKHVGLKFVKLSRLAVRIATRYRGPLAA